MNSLVNPGAIATTSMVAGGTRDAVWNSILGFYSDFAGRQLSVNQEVFKSEAETNQREPGDRRADVCLRLHQGEAGSSDGHLHRAVFGERQRERPRDDGRDARCGGRNR
jgi:hypothetical protein